jgi:hypothetical protein
MDKRLLEEISRNKRLMNISESKILLNEMNLGPELEVIFKNLAIAAPTEIKSVLKNLQVKFPNANELFTSEGPMQKLISFIGRDSGKMESVLALLIKEGAFTAEKLADTFIANAPNDIKIITNAFEKGMDLKKVEQLYGAKFSGLPVDVKNTLLNKIQTTVGATAVDIQSMISGLSDAYPELFQKSWFKGYTNSNMVKNSVAQAKKLVGSDDKNQVNAEIKKIFQEANDLLKQNNPALTQEKKSGLMGVLSRIGKVLNPVVTDPVHGNTAFLATGGKIVAGVSVMYVVVNYLRKLSTSDGVSGAIVGVGKDEYNSAKNALKTYEGNQQGLINFLNNRFGKLGFEDILKSDDDKTRKYDAYRSPSVSGGVDVVDLSDKDIKHFKYDVNKQTWNEIK